ncbi:MAG TPA: hypothetical protein VHH32_07140 [Gemmatimonadales bacterium]|nr:hypothetical protein [Gemmatimonadales bacterium]
MTRIWLTGALILLGCRPHERGAPVRTSGPPSTPAATTAASLPAGSPEWQIDLSGSGPLSATSSEADLRRHYGASVVESARIELGEGETAPGTVIYPSDSLRRAEIIWQDTLGRRRPARVILRGSQSKWQVSRGISLGTSLQELEQVNGKPFTLAGFGWDYAGAVTDWNGGALESALTRVKLYLDPGPAQYESAPYSQVLGDRDYSSALPAMQQLSPRVTQIFIDFE